MHNELPGESLKNWSNLHWGYKRKFPGHFFNGIRSVPCAFRRGLEQLNPLSHHRLLCIIGKQCFSSALCTPAPTDKWIFCAPGTKCSWRHPKSLNGFTFRWSGHKKTQGPRVKSFLCLPPDDEEVSCREREGAVKSPLAWVVADYVLSLWKPLWGTKIFLKSWLNCIPIGWWFGHQSCRNAHVCKQQNLKIALPSIFVRKINRWILHSDDLSEKSVFIEGMLFTVMCSSLSRRQIFPGHLAH